MYTKWKFEHFDRFYASASWIFYLCLQKIMRWVCAIRYTRLFEGLLHICKKIIIIVLHTFVLHAVDNLARFTNIFLWPIVIEALAIKETLRFCHNRSLVLHSGKIRIFRVDMLKTNLFLSKQKPILGTSSFWRIWHNFFVYSHFPKVGVIQIQIYYLKDYYPNRGRTWVQYLITTITNNRYLRTMTELHHTKYHCKFVLNLVILGQEKWH